MGNERVNEMESGVIKFFNNKQDKLFGFIESTDGDVFFHLNNGPAPVNGKKRLPQKGDRVRFEREMGQKGPKAKSWSFQDEVGEPKEPLPPVWTGKTGSNNLSYSYSLNTDTVGNIQANLKRFGLEDPMVVGVVDVMLSWNHHKVEIGPMLLSELCGRAVRGEIKLNHDVKDRSSNQIDFTVQVFRDGQHIGHIDSDRRFGYRGAPDLRTCVGWAAATDAGHYRELLFQLDDKVEKLKQVLSRTPMEGTPEEVEEFFSGDYRHQLKHLWQNATRFGDGYNGVWHMFFDLGTMELFGRIPTRTRVVYLH